MKIKIFENIDDTQLRKSWTNLQCIADSYPQMYYEWVAPWVRMRFNNRKLNVITLIENNEIICIAPFCIEKKAGLNILNSIPIHYGDRYEFICKNSKNDFKIYKYIINYLINSKSYDVVQINQVQYDSELFRQLKKYNLKNKIFSTCPITDYTGFDYKDLLMQLKVKVRSDYNRRQRRLSELGEIIFEINKSKNFYLENQEIFRSIYEDRWQDSASSLKDDNFYNCREESFTSCLDKGNAMIVTLKLDSDIIGYRFGFIHKKIYYDWKICFSKKFSKFGVGSIITGKLIEFLDKEGIKIINHGPGNYSYKRDWSPQKQFINNYIFLSYNNRLFSYFYVNFQLKYKQIIKSYIQKIKKQIQ